MGNARIGLPEAVSCKTIWSLCWTSMPFCRNYAGAFGAWKCCLADSIPQQSWSLPAVLTLRNALDSFRQNDRPLPQAFFGISWCLRVDVFHSVAMFHGHGARNIGYKTFSISYHCIAIQKMTCFSCKPTLFAMESAISFMTTHRRVQTLRSNLPLAQH